MIELTCRSSPLMYKKLVSWFPGFHSQVKQKSLWLRIFRENMEMDKLKVSFFLNPVKLVIFSCFEPITFYLSNWMLIEFIIITPCFLLIVFAPKESASAFLISLSPEHSLLLDCQLYHPFCHGITINCRTFWSRNV